MSDLKTDYKDDVLDVSTNVKRIFNLVDQDGKIVVANVSIQDITKYTQEGDSFGAADINATNEAVNDKFDSGDVVNPMETTEPGFAADALAVKNQFSEQNKKLEWTHLTTITGKQSQSVDLSNYIEVLVVLEYSTLRIIKTIPIIALSSSKCTMNIGGYYGGTSSVSSNVSILMSLTEVETIDVHINGKSVMAECTVKLFAR